MLETVAQALTTSLETGSVAAFTFAFAGGLFTGFSPCVLPFFPVVIGYVAKNAQDKPASGRLGFRLSLFFVIGFSLTFAVMGSLASYLGGLLPLSNRVWYIIVGIVMIVVGLHFAHIIQLKIPLPGSITADKLKFSGNFGAFVLGIILGVILTPCATPVVAVILTYVAAQGNALLGSALLFTYGLAHGLPLMAAGTSAGFVTKTDFLQKRRSSVEVVSGVVFIILGLYFLWLA